MEGDSGPEFSRFQVMLEGPGRLISPGEFELLTITAEDLAHLIRLVDDQWFEFSAEIRPYSTVLRRLLCGSGDLHKAANLMRWRKPFRVTARVMKYPKPHSRVIASTGGWRWGKDTLPDNAALFGGGGSLPSKEWEYHDGVSMPLTKYIDSMSFAITGTRVTRRDVITFVANKKAAHTDDSRNSAAHQALDHFWHSFFMTRVGSDGTEERLNGVYLELLTIIHTIAESPDIRLFVDHLVKAISKAARIYDPETTLFQSVTVPVPKLND